jgi:hypothetical protein
MKPNLVQKPGLEVLEFLKNDSSYNELYENFNKKLL